MSTTPRFIIVDDFKSEIQYTGPWFPDAGSEYSLGSNGPPYKDTLHGTKSDASLSLTFSGTQFKVVGSINIRNDSGVVDPTWQCFIDDISIDPIPPSPDPENNWIFCEQDALLDGPHIITVDVTVLKNQTFWFDRIQYVPSPSVSLDKAAIVVDSSDPQLQYGQGWQVWYYANITTVAGSTFTFNFIGVSLSWHGPLIPGFPLGSSPATYSIDGQTPISFLLKGIPADTPITNNQKFFETAQYTAGPHTLRVVYEGTNSTPLTLDYLIIQNDTLSSTTTSVPSHATSSTTGNGASGTSTPVGAIAGGVIGGLVLIVLAILGFLLLRRNQKRAAQEKILISTPRPFDHTTLHSSRITPNLKPSFTTAELSQSIPSTSSRVTTYPTNLRPVPFKQSVLSLTNPSLSPPPLFVLSSVPSAPLPLPLSRAEREAEALAAMPSNTTSTSVVDAPPLYTPD
ncbi:hypothetical protein BYT27DRAFT_7111408 [Phlegmacium glaucopus]|nr:hypothetical protein BYT27DRAFT_7111408 [Phlegmacium glaucopus]